MSYQPLPFLGSTRDFGRAFREERKARGLTQAQIAATIQCERKTIVDLEGGRNVGFLIVMSAMNAIGKGLQIIDRRVTLDNIHLLLDEEDRYED